MALVKKHQTGFKQSLKDYFSISYKVKRGLMVLFVLMVAEIIALIWIRYSPPTVHAIDYSVFKKQIDAFYAANQQADSSEGKDYDETAEKISAQKNPVLETTPQLFSFNPNHLPEQDWQRLGFTEKQVHSIKNYESKGGVFKTKADVKKMYAISEREFSRIEPYIDLPSEKIDEPKTFKKISKPFLTVDIGTADTSELSTLPMVGEYLAFKIFTYREKLGGFYSINQLKEVYGMRDSSLQVILPHVILKDSMNLRRINLNTASFDELNMHPYISSKLANIILAYRTQHGPFPDINSLQKVALVDAELYRKIAPYLKVE